ncbi:MAG TPA: hypothetical protein VKN36_14380 [Eudoraea sp.]|nr:hypothetical protein [Eudoraea sp.]
MGKINGRRVLLVVVVFVANAVNVAPTGATTYEGKKRARKATNQRPSGLQGQGMEMDCNF